MEYSAIAAICTMAYTNDEMASSRSLEEMGGFEFVRSYSFDDCNAQLWVNYQTNEVTLAFPGANDAWPDITNLHDYFGFAQMVVGFGHAYKGFALIIANEAINDVSDEFSDYDFSIIGHSMGGMLADYAGNYFDIPVVALNAPRPDRGVEGEGDTVYIYSDPLLWDNNAKWIHAWNEPHGSDEILFVLDVGGHDIASLLDAFDEGADTVTITEYLDIYISRLEAGDADPRAVADVVDTYISLYGWEYREYFFDIMEDKVALVDSGLSGDHYTGSTLNEKFENIAEGSGVFTVYGGEGDDILVASNRALRFYGDQDSDTIDYGQSGGIEAVVLTDEGGEGGTFTSVARDIFYAEEVPEGFEFFNEEITDLLYDVEVLVGTNSADIIQFAGSEVYAGGGNDRVVAFGDAQDIHLGAGRDTVELGYGDHTIDGGDGSDTAILSPELDVQVIIDGDEFTINSDDGYGNHTIQNIEKFMFGDHGDDVTFINDGTDRSGTTFDLGYGQNEVVTYNHGGTITTGLARRDHDLNPDKISFVNNATGLLFSGRQADERDAESGSLSTRYSNFQELSGTNHNDVFKSHSQMDVFGLDGDDVFEFEYADSLIDGGAGRDLMTIRRGEMIGGEGADVFVFRGGVDLVSISDYSSEDDVLFISNPADVDHVSYNGGVLFNPVYLPDGTVAGGSGLFVAGVNFDDIEIINGGWQDAVDYWSSMTSAAYV
ncbi:hypothetical protein KUV57_11345 [Epibacterium sp. DP7N7-1]|nr:hypothetical protein [Epibacterium sp. DP7N7-1]